MSKPYGLTPFMEVVRPTYSQDAVWQAVEDAHGSMTVKEFIEEAAEAWAYQDRLQAENNAEDFAKASKNG